MKAKKKILPPYYTGIIFNEMDSKRLNLEKSKGLLEGSEINFYEKEITKKVQIFELPDFKYNT